MTIQTVTVDTLTAVTQAYSQLHEEQSAVQEQTIRDLQRLVGELNASNQALAGRMLAQEQTIQQQESQLRAAARLRVQDAQRRLQGQKRQQELLRAQRVTAVEKKHGISEEKARRFYNHTKKWAEGLQRGQGGNMTAGINVVVPEYMQRFLLGTYPKDSWPHSSYRVTPTPENLAYFISLERKYGAIVAEFQKARSS